MLNHRVQGLVIVTAAAAGTATKIASVKIRRRLLGDGTSVWDGV
jgi:hypothetical protein